MFTFKDCVELHRAVEHFNGVGKPVASLCHGSCVLLYTKNRDGSSLIEGKTVTSYANEEEVLVNKMSGTEFMPVRIEDEMKALGAKFVKAPTPWEPFAVRDGNLITGWWGSGDRTCMIECLLCRCVECRAAELLGLEDGRAPS